jgi:hypothetical protein
VPTEWEDKVIARAADLYREWESRPWYVKVWDYVRSECGYWSFRLRGK